MNQNDNTNNKSTLMKQFKTMDNGAATKDNDNDTENKQ